MDFKHIRRFRMQKNSPSHTGARLSAVLIIFCIAQIEMFRTALAAAPNVYLRSASGAPWGSTANETAMTRDTKP